MLQPVFLLSACILFSAPPPQLTDLDEDGVTADLDCDDGDGTVGMPTTWYPDDDADGYGDPAWPRTRCLAAAGEVDNALDCDDTDASLTPETTWYPDKDGDGFGAMEGTAACEGPEESTRTSGDCDDEDPEVHPYADERCNRQDDDCDGAVDEDAMDPSTWYPDADGDGYGDANAPTVACEAPEGAVPADGDCDDKDPTTFPGATEICGDGADNDCNGGAGSCRDPIGDHLLADADFRILGEEGKEGTVLSVAMPGDVTGDGVEDLAVGIAAMDSPGAIWLVPGTSPAPLSGEIPLEHVTGRWVGVLADDVVGHTVAGTGDLDADGFHDLVIGGSYAAADGTPMGAAYWVRGPVTAETSLVDATATLGGLAWDNWIFVDGVGDVSGDGVGDILAEDNVYSGDYTWQGRVFVHYGPPSGFRDAAEADAIVEGQWDSHFLGITAAGAGDVDGDGVDDVLIGSLGKISMDDYPCGYAYLFRGPVSGMHVALDADVTFSRTVLYGGSLFGMAVHGAGDINGDGLQDILVGDPVSLVTGMAEVFLFLGRESWDTTSATFSSDLADAVLADNVTGSYAGAFLSQAGDTNGDGHEDILLGSYEGSAWLVQGPLSGSLSLDDAQAALTTDSCGDSLECLMTVAGGSDLDADGYSDILVGDSNSPMAALFYGGGGW